MTVTNSISTLNPVVQTVSTSSGAVVTCNAQMREGVIPQQGVDGVQVITLGITPLFSTSILRIRFIFMASQDGASAGVGCALFQDAIANALAVSYTKTDTLDYTDQSLTHSMVSGTTAATTFKIRVGSHNAAGTVYVNADGAGNRRFGGVANTILTITEFFA